MHCSKAVSEGFLCKVLGFPGVPWVSCTVASVFEPESKERVVFLRVSHGFPKGFPGFLRFPPRFAGCVVLVCFSGCVALFVASSHK